VGKGSKKNTLKLRKRGKAARAAGETWSEWEQRRQHAYVTVPLYTGENIFARVDRRLARIDQRLAESAARLFAPGPLPNTSVASKLLGKEWIPLAFERKREKVLALTITEAGRKLADESKTAPDWGKKPLSAGYCTNELRKLKA
jgi:hypothetical protein